MRSTAESGSWCSCSSVMPRAAKEARTASVMARPGFRQCWGLLYHVTIAGRRLRLAAALLSALSPAAAGALDLQGHRGARGLAPENTLAGFARALAIGVSTLELDLGVTADYRLVVIHDSRLDPATTRGPDGRWLTPPTPAVRELMLAQLRQFDVGRLEPASRLRRLLPEPADAQVLEAGVERVGRVQGVGRDPDIVVGVVGEQRADRHPRHHRS